MPGSSMIENSGLLGRLDGGIVLSAISCPRERLVGGGDLPRGLPSSSLDCCLSPVTVKTEEASTQNERDNLCSFDTGPLPSPMDER
jgi:hypothetical protein